MRFSSLTETFGISIKEYIIPWETSTGGEYWNNVDKLFHLLTDQNFS